MDLFKWQGSASVGWLVSASLESAHKLKHTSLLTFMPISCRLSYIINCTPSYTISVLDLTSKLRYRVLATTAQVAEISIFLHCLAFFPRVPASYNTLRPRSGEGSNREGPPPNSSTHCWIRGEIAAAAWIGIYRLCDPVNNGLGPQAKTETIFVGHHALAKLERISSRLMDRLILS